MTNFHDYVSLDLETTGLDPDTCDIIEVAAVKVRDGKIVDRLETFVFTPLEISQHVSYLTGITASDIQNAPDFVDLIPKIQEFIGDDPLMGHNIWFDWNFLTQKGMKLENTQLWDTYIMSNILYPELPSHSLETNTKYFDIGHADSHRAMADVMACYELWNILMETFPEISAEQKTQIEQLQASSQWPLLEYFLQEKPAEKRDLALDKAGIYDHQKIDGLPNPASDHLSLHCSGYNPVDVASSISSPGKTLYVAGYEHTRAKLHESFPDGLQLQPPYSYLDRKKLKVISEKEKHEVGETTLILKTILNPESTCREDLVLSHPERGHWESIQANNEESEGNTYREFYQKTLEAEKVITSHLHLIHDVDYVQHFDRLVILEPQLLEDNATRGFGKNLTSDSWFAQSKDEHWTKQGELFFAQLDQLGNRLVPSSQYPEHIILTDLIIQSNEFIRLKTSIKEISETIEDEEIQGYMKYFQAFFQTGDATWIRWITVDPRRGVRVNVAPLSVKSLLKKHLFDKTPTLVISETSEHFEFLPEMKLEKMTRAQAKNIIMPDLDEITGMRKDGDHEAMMGYLSGELPKITGNTAVVFSSKTALKRYFFDIAKVMPDTHYMLGEDISGGAGKMRDRYRSSESANKVIFMTYRNMRMFAPELLDLDTIILQSFPFDPPGFPVHQARSAQVPNSFMDYALPRTQQNLLEILSNFSSREGSRDLYVLDRRAQEKEYGEQLLAIV
jgi:DNA polymerase-3 subunit epsilon